MLHLPLQLVSTLSFSQEGMSLLGSLLAPQIIFEVNALVDNIYYCWNQFSPLSSHVFTFDLLNELH